AYLLLKKWALITTFLLSAPYLFLVVNWEGSQLLKHLIKQYQTQDVVEIFFKFNTPPEEIFYLEHLLKSNPQISLIELKPVSIQLPHPEDLEPPQIPPKLVLRLADQNVTEREKILKQLKDFEFIEDVLFNQMAYDFFKKTERILLKLSYPTSLILGAMIVLLTIILSFYFFSVRKEELWLYQSLGASTLFSIIPFFIFFLTSHITAISLAIFGRMIFYNEVANWVQHISWLSDLINPILNVPLLNTHLLQPLLVTSIASLVFSLILIQRRVSFLAGMLLPLIIFLSNTNWALTLHQLEARKKKIIGEMNLTIHHITELQKKLNDLTKDLKEKISYSYYISYQKNVIETKLKFAALDPRHSLNEIKGNLYRIHLSSWFLQEKQKEIEKDLKNMKVINKKLIERKKTLEKLENHLNKQYNVSRSQIDNLMTSFHLIKADLQKKLKAWGLQAEGFCIIPPIRLPYNAKIVFSRFDPQIGNFFILESKPELIFALIVNTSQILQLPTEIREGEVLVPSGKITACLQPRIFNQPVELELNPQNPREV
ncbi:MAG: hypothetical protein NZ480_02990, partial [Bdellovibrionaceae bacterium]|nr:hypothetical protein [Pseudobdellovibrionaceae bacterium]